MKKIILTLTLIVLVLALAACGGTSVEPQAEISAENGNAEISNNNDSTSNEEGVEPANSETQFTIPTDTAMMLGTVMLEETDYAVDAAQASALLPLWKALRSLGESETAAQAEIDAVISQIEDTMTPEQLSTIEAMQLTMQDMSAVAEILGIEMDTFGGRFGEMTPEMQATREAARESGDFSGSGPGGGQGPGGGFGGAEMDPAARETAIAERGGTRGAGFGVNSFLLDGIIEFLEAKIQ